MKITWERYTPAAIIPVILLFTTGISHARNVPVANAARDADTTTTTKPTQCMLPAPGGSFVSAAPSAVNMNATVVQEAIAYAETHNRLTVQVFRHNCRIATGALDPLTDGLQNNVFSVTKSVVSILTGIAYDRGALQLDDEIGKYLPTGLGWGNPAHRAITILDLLTETSGLTEAILSEAGTIGLDENAPQEALAQQLKYPPGTHFEYTQRVPDLLLYVVQRALNVSDIQAFAQTNVFDIIGIPQDSYFWLRDRSGNTYGYANLFIPATQLAKLGLLMQNGGVWNGHRVLSEYWVTNVAKSSVHNPCYGWLFWTNEGNTCTGANIPSAQTYERPLLDSAPRDLFAMVGALQQNNFMIPSLDMTVTWSGAFGDEEPNLAGILSAAPSADLYYNFFRILMRAVEDVHVPDPGPFKDDPLDLDVNPLNYASPQVLLNDIVANPDCNIIVCDGTVPSQGAIENLQAIANAAYGSLNGSSTA